MKVHRSNQNPLILPDNVKASREDFEVHYVMNCGVTEFEGDVLLQKRQLIGIQILLKHLTLMKRQEKLK